MLLTKNCYNVLIKIIKQLKYGRCKLSVKKKLSYDITIIFEYMFTIVE